MKKIGKGITKYKKRDGILHPIFIFFIFFICSFIFLSFIFLGILSAFPDRPRVQTLFEKIDRLNIPILENFIIEIQAEGAKSQVVFALLNEIYVDNNAPAGGDGSITNPFNTIQQGLNVAVAGDSIFVRGDTSGAGRVYGETPNFVNSGTAGNVITLKNYPGEKVIVQTTGQILFDQNNLIIDGIIFDHLDTDPEFIFWTGDNITLKNSEVKNGLRAGIRLEGYYNAAILNNSIHNFRETGTGGTTHCIRHVQNPAVGLNRIFRLINNSIYDCSADGIQFYATSEINVPDAEQSRDILIEGNKFYLTEAFANGLPSPLPENAIDMKEGSDMIIRNNEMHTYRTSKIIVIQKGHRNITIEGNIIHDGDRGLEIRAEVGGKSVDVKVIRNVIYNINYSTFYALRFVDAENVDVYHNTIYNSPGDCIQISSPGIINGNIRDNLCVNSGTSSNVGSVNLVFSHNGWFNAGCGGLCSAGTDTTGTNPQFVDVLNNDFHLQSTSPVIDRGIDVGFPFAGSAPDLGAYENGTISGPPPPVCGNALLESGEECDDGNIINGDGCTASCKIYAKFGVIGDYSRGTDLTFTSVTAVSNLVKSWNPDFIITTGDNNYPSGSASTIDENIGQFYHDFIFPYTGSWGAGSTRGNRFWPSLGNHDWDAAGAAPYLSYFTLSGNERYYNFTFGNIHFFVVDSDPSEPDGISSTLIQGQWLQNQLALSTSTFNVVYFHHPPYSSGANHGSTPALQWPYQAWGADVVLSGHDHLYERIIQGGFPYFVNGLGGRSIYNFATPVSGSIARYNGAYGAMLVEANKTNINFTFINVTNDFIDSYTLSTGVQTCTDADSDYYNATAGGNCGAVADCNDNNAGINPGRIEICGNGVDENCNPNDDICSINPVCTTISGTSVTPDDPAIWINSTNPAESLVLVAYKGGDLKSFRARDCSSVSTITGMANPNNVDVEYGLNLAGEIVDIAVMTERLNNRLLVFKLPNLLQIGAIPTVLPEPMGVTLYKDSLGNIDAFVSAKTPTTGTIQQYRLDGTTGAVTGTLVRRFGDYTTEVEALSVEDEQGRLYASHERSKIDVYDATNGNFIQSFGQTGFALDREGSAIYACGNERYFLISDQGASRIRIYNISNNYAFIGEFIASGSTQTDGIEITKERSITNFPSGIFASQNNDLNVILYRWGDIASLFGLTICSGSGCGNGVLESGEQCDDGNTNNNDACTNSCLDAVCGDGIIRTGIEECDDGNINGGDGCSPSCLTELGCTTSSLFWQNFPITTQIGTFTATFNATPNNNNMNGVTGLSFGTATLYTDLANILRFNSTGFIDARDGSAYRSDISMPYIAGTRYQVRLVVNIPARTYNIYVTPAGGVEQTLGTNYLFRSEQATITTINNWALYAGAGTHTICGMSISTIPSICTDTDLDGYNATAGGNCGAVADCNDNNANVKPNALELCDGIDNQCPGDVGYGTVDEGCPAVCGDGICSAGENCPADAIGCVDNLCYEPTCVNGCSQVTVANGGNDESCVLPNTCDGAGNCVAPQCITNADCNDGAYCNGIESCVSGSCVAGTAVNCNDGVSCTIDSCNEASDSCSNTADNSLCNNGLYCDGTETCNAVLGCQSGALPCTGQICDEAGDVCVIPPVPTIQIVSPLDGENIIIYSNNMESITNVTVRFNVGSFTLGGKGQNHIHFSLSNVTGYSSNDDFMFYDGNDDVVEFNLIAGVTSYATWIDGNTIRFKNVSLGGHLLRARLVDSVHAFIGNSEAERNITFNITSNYCGDNICSSNFESCSSCSADCGQCPSPPSGGSGTGGGGSSGGGGSAIITPKPPIAEPINTTEVPPELESIELSDDVQFVNVENGEQIILEIHGKDVSYIVSFVIEEDGIVLRVLNGDYNLGEKEVLSLLLEDKEIYLGAAERGEERAVIALSLDKEKVRREVVPLSEFKNKASFVFVLIGIFMILSVVVIALIIWYSVGNKKQKAAIESFRVFGQK